MLSQNIKKYRKAKGLSQEELAVGLHVVRQTVSKWENGLSVPDAQALLQLSQQLGVPVSTLLGVDVEEADTRQLSQELERVNGELARLQQHQALVRQAGRKRGLMLLLVLLALLVSLGAQSPWVSLAVSGVCILATLVILYRNMALLTQVDNPGANLKPIRATSLFVLGVFLVTFGYVMLRESGTAEFSQRQERMFAVLLVTAVMAFAGAIGPRLPFNRHTGLRLPWTVGDEETWHLAHRILGYISLPMAGLYLACGLTIDDLGLVTLCFTLMWVGIPSLISFLFFWKKYHS